MSIRIRPITSKADRKRFVDIAFRLNAKDPNWIPPLRAEALELITPGKNPFYEHAEQQLYIAERGGTPVGRISAHIDHLWLAMPAEQGGGPTIGNWGLLEAVDQEVATTLIATAEEWLRGKGMTILRSAGRGDLYIEVGVETPVKLNKRQKELLQEFEKAGGESVGTHPESEGFFAKVKEFLGG